MANDAIRNRTAQAANAAVKAHIIGPFDRDQATSGYVSAADLKIAKNAVKQFEKIGTAYRTGPESKELLAAELAQRETQSPLTNMVIDFMNRNRANGIE